MDQRGCFSRPFGRFGEMASLLLLVFVFFIIWLMMPFFALAQAGNVVDLEKQIAERRTKIQELEESMGKVRRDIDKKIKEAVSLKNQVSLLENHVKETELDIALTEEKIGELGLEIRELDGEISEKEQVIERQKRLIAELVRAIQYDDRKKYVEIIAVYRTFSDFYNKLQALERVERSLGHETRLLREAREDLDGKRDMAEDRRKVQLSMQAALADKRKDLEEQKFAKQDLLAQTRSSEAAFRAVLTNLRRQHQEIEGEITSYEQQVRKKLEEEKKLAPEFAGKFAWPAPSRYITTYFHDPEYPYRHVFEHSGVDIRAGQGTAVRSAASGYVGRAKRCKSASCYSFVMVIHAGGLSTVYGHLSSIAVSEDQFVTRGDIIGYSGGTPGTVGAGPFVTGPHLHLEVRKDGVPVDPLTFLTED